jgi:hypothetical protein
MAECSTQLYGRGSSRGSPPQTHQAQAPQLVELHRELEAGLAVHARSAVRAAVEVEVRAVERHRVPVAPVRMIHAVCTRHTLII